MDGLPLIATNVPVRAVGDGVGDLADFVVVPNDEFDDDAKKDATATKLLATSSSPSLVSSFPPPEVEGAEFLDLAAPAPSASPSPLSPASSIAADACDAPSASDVAPEGWDVPASSKSRRTHNPIRAVVDPVASGSIKCGKERGDGKDQISLALGDPTAYGTFPPCPALIPAVAEALSSPGMAAGYVDARGAPGARRAIAKFHSTSEGASDDVEANVDADDVIVANGASGALELALTALLDEGSVLLVPRPGFPLYQVIAESHGARVRHYDLLPDRGWEVDLDHVRRIVEEEERSAAGKVVRGIVVNNPSNPTGAVYSREHLREIVALAGRHKVPIVADEIYGDMTFDDAAFRPMAEVAAQLGREVPVIAASGLGKQCEFVARRAIARSQGRGVARDRRLRTRFVPSARRLVAWTVKRKLGKKPGTIDRLHGAGRCKIQRRVDTMRTARESELQRRALVASRLPCANRMRVWVQIGPSTAGWKRIHDTRRATRA
ncbi:hypothetical protein ACHAWF_007600 [Thalassiosira exigua]